MENHVCKKEYEDIFWEKIVENWRKTIYTIDGQFNLAVSTSIASGVAIGEYATGVTGALQKWVGRAFGAISGLISFALSERTPYWYFTRRIISWFKSHCGCGNDRC
jgi:hypothetical protein